MTQKSANIYARIEPDIKKQAEYILSSLGVVFGNLKVISFQRDRS